MSTAKAIGWLHSSGRWLLLLLCAGAAGEWLHYLGLPAARMIGAMLVAIVFACAGWQLRLGVGVFRLAQGTIGVLVALSLSPAVLTQLIESGPLLLLSACLTLFFSVLVAWVLIRFARVEAEVAAWGLAPGAASAMVAIADQRGADSREVATLQYLRVVLVALVGASISHWLVEPSAAATAPSASSAEVHLLGVLSFVALLGLALLAGNWLPAGALLLPIIVGGALHISGFYPPTLPPFAGAAAFVLMGCYVGLKFDRNSLKAVVRQIPLMCVAIIGLITLCAGTAWLLAYGFEMDFLTLYLASSPGGLDSMAIIALETGADVSQVLALQTLRLILVIAFGAGLARVLIRLSTTKA